MEIEPVPLNVFAEDYDGTKAIVDGDVSNVAADLYKLNPYLKLRVSLKHGFFIVYKEVPRSDGSVEKTLVTTAQDCDQRLVNRVEKIMDPSYNIVKEMDRIDAQAEKNADHAFYERVGEAAEKLAHALRADLGYRKDADRNHRRRKAT